MRICLLVPDASYPERWDWAFDVQAEALRHAGLTVTAQPWTNVDGADGFDLILPLVAWGYNIAYTRWTDLLDRAERERWRLANPAPLLRWNSDKTYLSQLADAGIPTVPTMAVPELDNAALDQARAQFSTDDLIVKPPVSAGADGTYRLGVGDLIPTDVAGRRMLIQPFLPAITEEGEWSLMLFGGRFSHAIVKQPKPGDFRVQPHLGGSDAPGNPPTGALDLAKAALAAAPAPATYARVDIIRDAAGALRIMELELIEPALFLQHSPDRGASFAAAVRDAAAQP